MSKKPTKPEYREKVSVNGALVDCVIRPDRIITKSWTYPNPTPTGHGAPCCIVAVYGCANAMRVEYEDSTEFIVQPRRTTPAYRAAFDAAIPDPMGERNTRARFARLQRARLVATSAELVSPLYPPDDEPDRESAALKSLSRQIAEQNQYADAAARNAGDEQITLARRAIRQKPNSKGGGFARGQMQCKDEVVIAAFANYKRRFKDSTPWRAADALIRPGAALHGKFKNAESCYKRAKKIADKWDGDADGMNPVDPWYEDLIHRPC